LFNTIFFRSAFQVSLFGVDGSHKNHFLRPTVSSTSHQLTLLQKQQHVSFSFFIPFNIFLFFLVYSKYILFRASFKHLPLCPFYLFISYFCTCSSLYLFSLSRYLFPYLTPFSFIFICNPAAYYFQSVSLLCRLKIISFSSVFFLSVCLFVCVCICMYACVCAILTKLLLCVKIVFFENVSLAHPSPSYLLILNSRNLEIQIQNHFQKNRGALLETSTDR
jgi:hypothetical protein